MLLQHRELLNLTKSMAQRISGTLRRATRPRVSILSNLVALETDSTSDASHSLCEVADTDCYLSHQTEKRKLGTALESVTHSSFMFEWKNLLAQY